ncbi:MAG: signal recognition particle receptor subunit alpha, partial [Myxococcota bacterium]
MSSEAMAALLLGGFGLLVVVFFIFALRKARRRRMEDMAEPASLREREERPELDRTAPAPEAPATPEPAPAAVTVPEPEPEPEARSVDVGEPAAAPPPAEAESAPEEPATDDVVEEAVVQDAAPAPVDEAPDAAPDEAESREAMQRGLTKTRETFLGKLNSLFGGGKKVDGAVLDELEEVLLTADVGVSLTMDLIDQLREELSKGKLDSAERVRDSLREKMTAVVTGQSRSDNPLAAGPAKPHVILFVGVNGVGKTTTIGKIATKLTHAGHSVVMAAGDTFRAAAAEQLQVWAERSGARLIRGDEGADPASVVFNAVKHATETGADYVLADTA